MTQFRMLGEVALAMLLGALLGLERQFANKPAGLRTHMLVAGAAAMLVEGARALAQQFLSVPASPLIRFDPAPVITAVVTAVGFLGAGTILRHGDDQVEGLTTAASMLFAATPLRSERRCLRSRRSTSCAVSRRSCAREARKAAGRILRGGTDSGTFPARSGEHAHGRS